VAGDFPEHGLINLGQQEHGAACQGRTEAEDRANRVDEADAERVHARHGRRFQDDRTNDIQSDQLLRRTSLDKVIFTSRNNVSTRHRRAYRGLLGTVTH